MRVLKKTVSKMVFVLILFAIVLFVIFVWSKNSGVINFRNEESGLESQLLQKGYVGTGPFTSEGVVPPTNKWFSALAFKQPSAPIYPQPLAVQFTNDGIAIGRPEIQAGKKAITAPFMSELSIRFEGKVVRQQIASYDDLSVEVEQISGTEKVLSSRVTRGSPFVFMRLSGGETLSIDADLEPVASGNNMFLSVDKRFGIYIDKNASLSYEESTKKLQISSESDARISVFTVPEKASIATYFAAAEHPIVSTKVNEKITDSSLETRIELKTESGEDTIYGLLPFMSSSDAHLGEHDTLEGKQRFYAGNDFLFKTDRTVPRTKLDISRLSEEQTENLRQLVREDVKILKFEKEDSYFAGKELYRAAQLLQLSEQLGMKEESDAVRSQLIGELEQWFDPEGYKKRSSKYFYYDDVLKGVTAVTPSFGSEEFNDHHFHYGYFIAAAAVVAEYDEGFKNKHKEFVDMLTKDIANANREDKAFPYLRVFDSYIGHSWASGFGVFNDGQNQESSSEAVHAWSAVYHWATVAGDSELSNTAEALFTREAQAANRQWVHIDKSSDLYRNYAAPYVSLVWSGKFEDSTFFSDEQEAKLGIQLLPLQPSASQYLKTDPKRADQNLAGMNLKSSQFSDYLIMYQALSSAGKAQENYETLDRKIIDGALSESYIYAWIYSQD